jgi:hypothetical protein
LDGDPPPTNVTALGILQFAVFFFFATVLVKLALRQELPRGAA